MSDRITELEKKVDFLESYIRLMLVSGCMKHGEDYLFTHYKDENLKQKCMEVFLSYMNSRAAPLSDRGKEIIADAEEIGKEEMKADYESKTIN